MLNSGRTVVAMLVGVVLMMLGCGDKELETIESESGSSAPALAWAEVLEQNPDPRVVTDADFLRRITETKLPWRVKDKATGIEMLLVPPGKFAMGMSPGDSGALANEKPAHEVTITKPFYLGRTEVTHEEWAKVMKEKSGSGSVIGSFMLYRGLTKQEARAETKNYAVEIKDWDDCQKFCELAGMALPTEAQWEYACRAGVRKPQYGKLADIAWESPQPHPVGQLLPNALGFFDMLGTQWEWCKDWYADDYYNYCEDGAVDPSGPKSGKSHVLRGGSSWPTYSPPVSASSRITNSPSVGNPNRGFRVARTP